MPPVVPHVPPGDYELPPIVGKHEGFILGTSLGYAALFGELGLATYLASGGRNDPTAAALLLVATLVVLMGYLASFHLPPRLMPEHDQSCWIPHTLNFLMGQFFVAVACVAVTGIVALSLFVSLVYPDLYAISWLVRDGFLYVVLGAFVYHGFVAFVRYLGFLYQTGGADRLKVITFEVAATAFLLIGGLFQYSVDLARTLSAGPGQGLLALHLAVRDIGLAIMVGVVFLWQIGRVGDH